MRWECEHCNREFSKSYALTQHISQRHPYTRNATNQIVNEQFDDNIWDLPEYSSDYNSSTDYEVNWLVFLLKSNYRYTI